MYIKKVPAEKVMIKDLNPGTVFSLSSGSTCLMLTAYKDGELVPQIVILKGNYNVQNFCEEEFVTVHYGAELILR